MRFHLLLTPLFYDFDDDCHDNMNDDDDEYYDDDLSMVSNLMSK